MKLVVGLGNPGQQYERTRHNAGFWVVDELCAKLGVACTKAKWKALVGETRVGTERVVVAKPQTYMNLSGESVRAILDYYTEIVPESDVIVVYDDMDFPVGQLRLREKGSAGGHNGVKSIIQHAGTQLFPRVRLGIGRPESQADVIHYVLSPFAKADQPLVTQVVERAAQAIQFAVEHSFTLAMNRYNT